MKDLRFRYFIGFLLLALALGTSACFVFPNSYSAVPPGPWRGILKLEFNPVAPNPRGEPLPEKVDMQFAEVTEGQLPFNFSITYVSGDSLRLTLQNAQQAIVVDDIIYGRNRATGDDTIRFYFPQGETYLRGKYAGGIIEGEWVETQSPDNRIPFVAYHGKDHRFTVLNKTPAGDLTGNWTVTLGLNADSTYTGVASFTQTGNQLTGRLETDRQTFDHLEGTVQENKLYLSYFDGQRAILIEGKIMENRQLIGSLRAGMNERIIWEAVRDTDGERTPASPTRDTKN